MWVFLGHDPALATLTALALVQLSYAASKVGTLCPWKFTFSGRLYLLHTFVWMVILAAIPFFNKAADGEDVTLFVMSLAGTLFFLILTLMQRTLKRVPPQQT